MNPNHGYRCCSFLLLSRLHNHQVAVIAVISANDSDSMLTGSLQCRFLPNNCLLRRHSGMSTHSHLAHLIVDFTGVRKIFPPRLLSMHGL